MKTTPKIKRVKVFRISRRWWWRGKGDVGSVLIRSLDNKKCCLGFFCLAAGMPKTELINVGAPDDLRITLDQLCMPHRELKATTKAMITTNDNRFIPDKEHESKLRKLFRKIGTRVIFTK